MTEIVIADITTGDVAGDGIFDKLMVGVKAHIQQEYDNGRIKGSDYASVYLGALQSVLAQSVEVVLRDKQIGLQQSLQDVQIESIVVENTIKQEKHNYELSVLLPDEHDKNLKVIEDASAQIDLKVQQLESVGLDNTIKQERHAYDLGVLLPDEHNKNLKVIEEIVAGVELKTQQIESVSLENTVKQERHNYDMEVLLPDEHNKNVKVLEEVGVQIELKNQQVEGVILENNIKQEQNIQDLAIKYVQQVKADKETAMVGLDGVMKSQNQNTTSGYVYTPQYIK